MRVLVIGGTGFIGLPLVKNLVRENHDVVVVSRGHRASELPSAVSHILMHRKDDISFKTRFASETFDAIYDIAAFTPRNIMQIGECFSRSLRYIFISSAAVYGTEDYPRPIPEKTPFSSTPWHEYGYNKWIAEQELANFPHLKWVIARPCVVYGPRDPHEPRVSYFFRRILHEVPIVIPGRSDICNNYIYVEDLARLLLLCLKAPEGAIFNAGGAQAFRWPEYLNILGSVMGRKVPPYTFLGMSLDEFRNWEYCTFLQFHHNAFYNFVLDIHRARQMGWEPFHSLEDGLKATWQWLWENRRKRLMEKDSLEAEKKWALAYFK